MDMFEALYGLCIGVGLAAACGFRVFVPMLVMGLAAKSGHLSLASGFDWMGSDAAIVAFGIATALEIGGYYVPWLDNLLDSVATPAAGIAGTIATASMVTGMDPIMQWSLGVIAGGGSALTVQALTVGTRAVSTLTTGGIANPLVSTVEAGASTALAFMAIVVPVLAVLAVLLLAAGLVSVAARRKSSRVATVTANTPALA